MKKLSLIFTILFALCASAELLMLSPGYNNPGAAGEIVAIRAATSNAAATVALKTVQSFTTYTNATAQTISFETAYALIYTNFDGSAAIATNCIGYVDYDYFRTNGVSKIIKGPTRFDMAVTNTVVTGKLPAATYVQTNDLATVTASGHFGSVVTNGFLLGDAIIVTGAADGDIIKVLIK